MMEKLTKEFSKPSAEEIANRLTELNAVTLGSIAKFLLPARKNVGSKDASVRVIANFLGSLDQNSFTIFLKKQKPWIQEALYLGAYWEFVDFNRLCSKYSINLKIDDQYYYEEPSRSLIQQEPALSLFGIYGNNYIFLYEIFRKVFVNYLEKPREYFFEEVSEPPTTFWSNETKILDTFNLLIKASEQLITREHRDVSDWMTRGLTKGHIKYLRSLCGQEEFPLSKVHGLDPIDLFFRWYLSFRSEYKIPKGNVPQIIKQILTFFFNPEKEHYRLNEPIGSFFEFVVLTEHLTLFKTNNAYIAPRVPECRRMFWVVSTECARDQRWFSVESLYKTLYARGFRFTYTDLYSEKYGLCCKADYIDLGNDTIISGDYQRLLYVWGPQMHRMLGLPLFKGYLYLFALLGLVEITEKEPPKPLWYKDKAKIISNYDGLDMIRFTKLGAYCLDLVNTYETVSQNSYEAIADKDLLLVTFRGKSLEHKLFLKQVGIPLGPDRFHLDETSFIQGCSSYREVEARIDRFKDLIEAEPSPRWKEFFKRLKARSELLKKPEIAMLFDLNEADPEVLALLKNEKVRPLYKLVEGNKIIVLLKDQKKFLNVAKTLGFFNDSWEV